MRNQEGYSQLRAPRDGVIASRQAEAGQVVAAGQTIFTLAADGGREVAIGLPENRIREFSVGQPVMVELWNAPGQRLPGTIREIVPSRAVDWQAMIDFPPFDAAAPRTKSSWPPDPLYWRPSRCSELQAPPRST